ncbi:MAG: AraC family transcriptional regulator [Bacteroidota bacterium]
MKTRIHSADLREMLLEAHYPDYFYDPTSTISERSYRAELFMGVGEYHEIYFDGVHIGYGDLSLKEHTRLHVQSDIETVEMHFTLEGNSEAIARQFGREIGFKCNEHNILYTRGFEGFMNWGARQSLRIFEVNLAPAFFLKFLPDEHASFRRFKEQLRRGQSAQLIHQHLPISPQMKGIIHEILHCKRSGMFKRMFLEAKVIELLLLQLEQVGRLEDPRRRTLKKADVDKMYAVKEILLDKLDGPFSLIDLARQVGTNDYTLKKGFKEVFGTTVFGFWHELKMRKARFLLEEERRSVFEVAQIVGYKNPQHFSTAFKRFFGLSPGQLKGH